MLPKPSCINEIQLLDQQVEEGSCHTDGLIFQEERNIMFGSYSGSDNSVGPKYSTPSKTAVPCFMFFEYQSKPTLLLLYVPSAILHPTRSTVTKVPNSSLPPTTSNGGSTPPLTSFTPTTPMSQAQPCSTIASQMKLQGSFCLITWKRKQQRQRIEMPDVINAEEHSANEIQTQLDLNDLDFMQHHENIP